MIDAPRQSFAKSAKSRNSRNFDSENSFMLKADIDKDLKVAMLSGDKRLVEVLRGLKSAILYKEVADNKRAEGLNDDEIVSVLKKEVKSRKDAIALYEQAGEKERVANESYQLEVINNYTPEEMSETAVEKIVQEVIKKLDISPTAQDMGKIIGAVKQAAPNADGAVIAKYVKNSIK